MTALTASMITATPSLQAPLGYPAGGGAGSEPRTVVPADPGAQNRRLDLVHADHGRPDQRSHASGQGRLAHPGQPAECDEGRHRGNAMGRHDPLRP
jgi:hypothetical protein